RPGQCRGAGAGPALGGTDGADDARLSGLPGAETGHRRQLQAGQVRGLRRGAAVGRDCFHRTGEGGAAGGGMRGPPLPLPPPLPGEGEPEPRLSLVNRLPTGRPPSPRGGGGGGGGVMTSTPPPNPLPCKERGSKTAPASGALSSPVRP